MIDCDTVEDFERIFQFTCIVAGHTHIDVILKTSLVRSPRNALSILENLISDPNKNIQEILSQADLFDPKTENNETVLKEYSSQAMPVKIKKISATEKWISDLISISKAYNSKDNELNAYYLPDFVDHLKRIAKEFPLWTNIVAMKENKRD